VIKLAIFRLWVASSITIGCLATFSPTRAQIVPDNTLPVNSQVTPGCTVCTIDGGTIQGTNLFHSFSEFSVPTGGGAFFNNTLQIQNILTRVTGNSVSNIDGLLRANGTANLFLLNPNGISFGANATLNLGGSFIASTASSLVFADGTVFSAKPNTSTPPLLTISVPLGLQYGSNPGSIQVQGATLEVGVGQTLALVGGNVQLNGAALYTPVEPPGGRVELGGLAGEGTVGLVANGEYLGLSFPVGVARGDVSLSNGAVVDVTAGGGGSIGINARNLTMTQGSGLLAGMLRRGAVDTKAGNIEINTTGAIDLTDGSYIFNYVDQRAKGQGGDVNITTSQLRVSGGAQVGAATFGEGDGGNLTINASQQVQLIGTTADGQYISGLFASAQPGSSGNAGDLTIKTGTLLVRDGAQVSAVTFGEGDGGILTVNASQQIQLIGRSADSRYGSGLLAQAEQGSSGNAGELIINTDTLLVRDGAWVSAGTFGEGDGGNLTVHASNQVQLIGRSADGRYGSGLFAQAEQGSSGNAGDLTINTGTLLVRDGAEVGAATFGEGDGGNLTVNADQDVQLIGTSADHRVPSGLFASAARGTSGKGGELTINTGTLLVRDGAQVSASTFGERDGGNLTVNASQQVELIGESADGKYASGLYAQANPDASGKAGDVTINTDTLLVRDEARVSVASVQGQAGNMTILANSVSLNGGSLLAVTAKSDAQGGANITLSGLDLLRMDNESLISANALDQANGGNVTIDSTFIVATPPTGPNGSDITANAGKGNGGAVNVTTQGLYGIQFRPKLTPKNDITVTSDFGINGTFQLTTPFVDPTQSLTSLPTEIVDPSRQIVQNCRAVRGEGGEENKFIVTGRGGIPLSPNEPLRNEEAIAPNWVTLDSQVKNHTPPTPTPPNSSTPEPLMEANGWIMNEKGQVELIASAPNVTPHGTWQPPVNCRQVSYTDSQK
jgi:filamentous hemagglutinin family protein